MKNFPNSNITAGGGELTPEWRIWFSQLQDSLPKSGNTRPTSGLVPGYMFFDTSLGAKGKPIWVNADGSGWVYADGTAV